MENKILIYEDVSDTIDRCIEKHRYSWNLFAVPSIDWSDVSQELRRHIWLKFHLWKQELPIEPWLGKVISNQIFNKLRDNYYSMAKPCSRCAFAQGEHGCMWELNPSRTQGPICPLYKKWLKNKKRAADIKLPVSTHFHENEISSIESSHVDIEKYFKLVRKKARRYLTPLEYKIFKMLYVDKKTEEDVAKMLKLKTTEKNRKAGYRQVGTHKARIYEKIKKLIEKEDIIQHG